jgi:serine/threonine-protein kinase RsbW
LEHRFNQEPAVIETSFLASEGNAEISVASYGTDVIKQVKSILRDLCLKQAATVELVLPLEDRTTYFLTSELEEMGFFFAGIMPRTRFGDALILQYLNNISVDYDSIKVDSDLARQLIAYIRQHDPNSQV